MALKINYEKIFMLSYYPSIKPYAQHSIPVDHLHTLYLEESGNPEGIPILFIHGGPGAGCHPINRCYFDPEKFRIILLDQRGCGQSKPHATLTNNTTQHLVEDIETIRKFLEIHHWHLCGSSWGALLSLIYTQLYPERVASLILRSPFLGRTEDIKWIYEKGANAIFPEHWEAFIAPIPLDNHHRLIQAYYERLTGTDDLTRMATAKAWATWEGHCATLEPHQHILDLFQDPFTATGLACIQAHYFMNDCFLKDNEILTNLPTITHIPATIIHGRYDILSPLSAAWTLHQHWPSSELNIVRDAGHSLREPSLVDALIRSTQKLAHRFK